MGQCDMNRVKNANLLISTAYLVYGPVFRNLGHQEVSFADNFFANLTRLIRVASSFEEMS